LVWAALVGGTVWADAKDQAAWVALGANGKLAYRALPTGDRIVDFSYAGYRGGGVPLPKVAVARTLTPSGADDAVAIQKALDEVSALPLGKDGFRGAVLHSRARFGAEPAAGIH
jgi:hypothetical protein